MARRPELRDDPSWAYLAPTDLREHDLPVQAALGFHRGRTDELLERAADTIERLNRELAEIRGQRDRWRHERTQLEEDLEEQKTRTELLLGEAMLDAHKAGQALRAEAEAGAEKLLTDAEALLESAKQESQQLVTEGRLEAEKLLADAEMECERLARETEQYKLLAAEVQRRSVGFLHRALEALSESDGDVGPPDSEVAPFRTADGSTAVE
jgi:cell division septum initiation protein DivIVA